MRANNLTISIPYEGCDKDCKYCVSKMTGYMKPDRKLFYKNMSKVKRLAEASQASSVLITGKGEPLLNMKDLFHVAGFFSKYPIELQTNGIKFKEQMDSIKYLSDVGVDVFALSFDHLDDFVAMKEVIKEIRKLNKTVRVTMNVSDMLLNPREFGFLDYIGMCKQFGVQQFSFRQLAKANFTDQNETHRWIEDHADNGYYGTLISQFEKEIDEHQFLRGLSYGAKLYDVHGISFTFFDYCIQDNSKDSEDIRSLIYQEDGHMYSSWASKASRIF